MPVATFRAGTAYADRTIVHERGAFVLEGEGALTAAEVMECDRGGQLIWADDGTRAWVGSRAAAARADPQIRKLLDKARRQYEMGKYKAAVSTLWDFEYRVLQDGDVLQDLEAARGILELAAEIGARVDGHLGAECANLVSRSLVACRGGRVRISPEASEAAADAAELPETAPAPVTVLPLAPPPAVAATPQAAPSEASPFTRKRLDKAWQQYEKGKYKAAVETLWYLDAETRQGDEEATRGIMELASEIGTHVEGSLGEECADLVARSRKTLPVS
jgi:hypothetical protein